MLNVCFNVLVSNSTHLLSEVKLSFISKVDQTDKTSIYNFAPFRVATLALLMNSENIFLSKKIISDNGCVELIGEWRLGKASIYDFCVG